jgi:hypothetical protein
MHPVKIYGKNIWQGFIPTVSSEMPNQVQYDNRGQLPCDEKFGSGSRRVLGLAGALSIKENTVRGILTMGIVI